MTSLPSARAAAAVARVRAEGSALEVLWIATKLGLISFGGPIAHLGYFREELRSLCLLFAYAAGAFSSQMGTGLRHGVKLVAVAVIAQAVWGMARTLCPDRERASIAAVSALIVLLSTSAFSQLATIVFGAVAGAWLCATQASSVPNMHPSRCRAG